MTSDADANPHFDVNRTPDIVFAEPESGPLLLDLYLPQGMGGPAPLIVWLHAGGWRRGDRKLGPDLTRHFAGRGFTMASIEYRLSGVAPFPAPIHDTKAAIRWLRVHADAYGVDPRRIGLWGSSAGGYLAAMAAITGTAALDQPERHQDVDCTVQAAVDCYGPVDFLSLDAQRSLAGAADDPAAVRFPAGRTSADADSFESAFLGAPIATVPDRVRMANPVSHVRAGLPPMLILHGKSDTMVPWQQSVLLFEALAAAGNTARLALIDRLGHEFFNRPDFGNPPRPVAWRIAAGGRELRSAGPPVGYGTILDFFREHLA